MQGTILESPSQYTVLLVFYILIEIGVALPVIKQLFFLWGPTTITEINGKGLWNK